MPNWVVNYLVINNEDIHNVMDKDKNVDFNIICPMPESLKVTSGGSNDYAICTYLSNKMSKSLKDVKKMPESALIKNSINKDWLSEIYHRLQAPEVTKEKIDAYYKEGEILVNNYKNYGAINWYDWSCREWGCKWNASDAEVFEEHEDVTVLRFDTPWGPPIGWLERLAETCPYYLEWEEEQGYHGEIYCFEKDNLYDNDLPDFNYYDEDEETGEVEYNEPEYTYANYIKEVKDAKNGFDKEIERD